MTKHVIDKIKLEKYCFLSIECLYTDDAQFTDNFENKFFFRDKLSENELI